MQIAGKRTRDSGRRSRFFQSNDCVASREDDCGAFGPGVSRLDGSERKHTGRRSFVGGWTISAIANAAVGNDPFSELRCVSRMWDLFDVVEFFLGALRRDLFKEMNVRWQMVFSLTGKIILLWLHQRFKFESGAHLTLSHVQMSRLMSLRFRKECGLYSGTVARHSCHFSRTRR